MPSTTELDHDRDDQDSDPNDHGDDHSMDSLVPRPSRRRTVVLTLGVVALLAFAWWSASVVQPVVVSTENRPPWIWSAVPESNQVLTATGLRAPAGWSVRVDGVNDVAGAKVVGAWLIPTDEIGEVVDSADAAYPDGMTQLAVELPEVDFGVSTALPRPVSNDRDYNLVVLWDIIDCSALQVDERVEVDISTAVTRVFGVQTVSLPDVATPSFDLVTLVETGICPAR